MIRPSRVSFLIQKGILTLLVLVLAVIALAWRIPLPRSLEEPIRGSLTLLDCRGRTIAQIASREARVQESIPLRGMGKWLPEITVALEDHRFHEHCGIDFHSTAAALLQDLKERRIVAGGSTISQQLVKMAEGRFTRSWLSKIRDALLACKLERVASKDTILEQYLNRADYGNRRLGVEAAAQAYFGKAASELDLPQSIYLAGLPQSPARFNPWQFPDRAGRKYRRSLARLAVLHIITSGQEADMAARPPEIGKHEPVNLAPHFTDALRAAYPALSGRVRTTLDLDLQNAVNVMLRDHLRSLNRFDVTDAAVVILNNATGGIEAMAGSPDYATMQLNGATSPRSCGSTLKPFIYLAAIDRRILTAATILPDTPEAIPETYRDYDPKDYDHRFLGPVRVREALGNSLNVPAVSALGRLGARPAFEELSKWGFQFTGGFDAYGAGFILGNAEIRLLDLAGAYAGLARGGLAMRPTFLAGRQSPMRQVASEEAVEIIDDILCDDAAREKTFGPNSALSLGARVAVKTGTSSGFRDGWAAGFNRDHTVAVWAGNPDGSPMRELLSVHSAAPLWAAIMRHLLLTDRPLLQPQESGKLARCRVSALTGMLPSGNERTVSELFLHGTAPSHPSSSSGGPITLPAEYAQWCGSRANWLGAVSESPPLLIRNPKRNAIYKLDPDIPQSQQMVQFVADADPAKQVEWFLNGTRVDSQPDGKALWRIAPGHWQIKVIANHQEASSTFSVEE